MKKIFDRNMLKYIAIIAMLIDHIGYYFVPVMIDETFNPIGFIFRLVGRLTAPIMCYFLAEGFYYTRSKLKYGIRLFIFALISQGPFLYSRGLPWNTLQFNMLFNLFLSFMILLCYSKIKNIPLKGILIIIILFLCSYCDWSSIAPLWVLSFYAFRDFKKEKFILFTVVGIIFTFLYTNILRDSITQWYVYIWQLGVFMAIPLLLMYNNKKGNDHPINKWIFYIIYPLHLLIIGLIIHLPEFL